MASAQEGKVTCESCGRQYSWKPPLAGKKAKCKCGAAISFPQQVPAPEAQDLYDVAEPPQDPSAPLEYQPPPPSAPAAPRKKAVSKSPIAEEHKAEKAAKLRQMAVILGALALVIGVVIGGKYLMPSQSVPPPIPQNLPGQDSRVAKMIADDGATEVEQWFKTNTEGGVIGFFWTRGKTEKVAEAWYKQGAKTVLAFGRNWTYSLAIELPDDKDKRQYFIDYAAEYRSENPGLHLPPQTDVGQKYIVIDFVAYQG
jgi:hypothetical protein